MKKFLLAGFLAMFVGGQAQAGFVSVITGADMAGLQVTATFNDGTTTYSESLVWAAISSPTGVPTTGTAEVIRLEGGQGGVSGAFFSLTQQGDSLGNVDNNMTPADFSDDVFYGLWTLNNLSSDLLLSLVISAVGTDVVFDSVYFDNGNGSVFGKAFIADAITTASPIGTYANPVQDELFRTLMIDLDLAGRGSMQFMADTDLMVTVVSTPATLSLVLLTLGGLVARRKKA